MQQSPMGYKPSTTLYKMSIQVSCLLKSVSIAKQASSYSFALILHFTQGYSFTYGGAPGMSEKKRKAPIQLWTLYPMYKCIFNIIPGMPWHTK